MDDLSDNGPTIGGRIERLLELRARREAIEEAEKVERAALEAEALACWRDDGVAPTWRRAGLGTVSLCGTDSTEARITDAGAYGAWAARAHAGCTYLVTRVPVTTLEPGDVEEAAGLVVRAAELARQLPGASVRFEPEPGLLRGLAKSGASLEGKLATEDGELVPGVAVVPKAPYLSVRLVEEAKARARAALEATAAGPRGDGDGEAAEDGRQMLAYLHHPGSAPADYVDPNRAEIERMKRATR